MLRFLRLAGGCSGLEAAVAAKDGRARLRAFALVEIEAVNGADSVGNGLVDHLGMVDLQVEVAFGQWEPAGPPQALGFPQSTLRPDLHSLRRTWAALSTASDCFPLFSHGLSSQSDRLFLAWPLSHCDVVELYQMNFSSSTLLNPSSAG